MFAYAQCFIETNVLASKTSIPRVCLEQGGKLGISTTGSKHAAYVVILLAYKEIAVSS